MTNTDDKNTINEQHFSQWLWMSLRDLKWEMDNNYDQSDEQSWLYI